MAKLEPKETSTHTYIPDKQGKYYTRRVKAHDIDKEAMVPIHGTEKGKYIGIPIDPLKTGTELKMPRTADAERRNKLEKEGAW